MPKATVLLPRAIVLALLSGSAADAAGQQCLGRGSRQWQVDETFLVVASPEGFENQLRANLCVPLIDRPGLLFDYTQLDVGIFNYLSPVYVQQGVYVGISPLSFLQLRADAAGVIEWPLPLDGAGYYPLASYWSPHRDADLPAAAARGALGVNLGLTVALQGEVPLSDGVELLASDSFSADYWYVGTGEYYVNLRRDLVLKRSDLLLKNVAFLVWRLIASETTAIHLGFVDDFSYVPGSREVINILSAFASVPIRRDRALRDIEPYVRAGAYTHHPSRQGFTLMLGVSLGFAFPAGH